MGKWVKEVPYEAAAHLRDWPQTPPRDSYSWRYVWGLKLEGWSTSFAFGAQVESKDSFQISLFLPPNTGQHVWMSHPHSTASPLPQRWETVLTVFQMAGDKGQDLSHGTKLYSRNSRKSVIFTNTVKNYRSVNSLACKQSLLMLSSNEKAKARVTRA